MLALSEVSLLNAIMGANLEVEVADVPLRVASADREGRRDRLFTTPAGQKGEDLDFAFSRAAWR
jgi:hypothetical protein